MSDSKDSTITYTDVSSPFADLLDIRSRGVDGPPVMLEDPYAYVVAACQTPPYPDYVSGPEYPPSPDFVPEPSDLEEDPEEDDDEDPKEDLVDYPVDGGDDGDDEDESSDDDEDDDIDSKRDEEEEEHPAPIDSTVVALPTVDYVLSAKETDPFETNESAATPPPHPAYRITARISIRDETPISLPPKEEVKRLLAMPTPPSSQLSPWLSPLPQIPFPQLHPIPSPSLPLSPPLPVSAPPPASPISPLGYRVVMIRLRAEAASTSHSLPLPPLSPISASTSSPPLLLPSTNCREDRLEVTLPPRKRLGIALGPR
ncbi:hypothetical protein Tco_0028122 [Tanacetum coccineum]